jgi:hypothetical protein
MQNVRLVVNIDDEIIQTGEGGRKAVTEAMLTGSGTGATVATVDNIVMKDTDGTLFFKRVTNDTPPVLTNWKLSDGSSYTITGSPVPYTVSTTNIEGTVEITNDTGNAIPVSGTFWQTTQPVSFTWSGLTDAELRDSAVPVSLTSTTITGTVASTQSGTWSVAATQSGSWSIGNTSFGISGTLPAFTSIPAFKIDQTTDGTTNLVAAKQNGTWNIGSITTLPALATGSNIIGSVSINQTTMGTTNAVVGKARYQASRPTLSDGTYSELQLDNDGSLIVNIADSSAIGAVEDAQATDAASSWSLVALVKGLFTKLVSLISLQTVTQTATQVITIAGTSAQSSAVGSTTTRVILGATTDCWISIGSNPTAVLHGSNSFFLKAGASSYPMTVIASTSKIAVIQDSAAGYLSILESI